MSRERPLGWKDTLDMMRKGWTLRRLGVVTRRASIMPPQDHPYAKWSLRVHGSGFDALVRAKLIEPIPGQDRFARSINFRLTKLGKGKR